MHQKTPSRYFLLLISQKGWSPKSLDLGDTKKELTPKSKNVDLQCLLTQNLKEDIFQYQLVYDSIPKLIKH